MVTDIRFASKLVQFRRVQSQEILRSSFVTVEKKTLVVQQGMARVLDSHSLGAVLNGFNFNGSANKSNLVRL
jgi:hypothetical protein